MTANPEDSHALRIEHWLRTEVVESYDEYKANPDSAIPADQIMARLRERRAARLLRDNLPIEPHDGD